MEFIENNLNIIIINNKYEQYNYSSKMGNILQKFM